MTDAGAGGIIRVLNAVPETTGFTVEPNSTSSEQVTGTARGDRWRRFFREDTMATQRLWDVELDGGVVVGFRCPRCHSAEEGTGTRSAWRR